MSTSLTSGFHWRESRHQSNPFKVNLHRTAHTLYYGHHEVARIEPSGKGLVVHFLNQAFDTPGRPVAVHTVRRGKTFVENWIAAREDAVIAACGYQPTRSDRSDVRLQGA